MSERTALYRLFAADGTLLYVGIAKRFGRRWEQHARVQPWWPHVDYQTVHWRPSRETAALEEKRAIEEERPVYNIAGSPWLGGVKDDGTGFYVVPKPSPDLPPATASARAAYDEAYRDLIAAIRSDLEAGATVTDVAEAATWSREYINQIRDGKAGDSPPKRRTTDRRSGL